MCGINGIMGHQPGLIEQANATLRHRGPDFSGVYLDDTVSLGHVLLSIRGQVGASQQPYLHTDSPWILLFNGQIYNTDEIRREHLSPQEHQNSELDTALLYAVIQKYGWQFITRIHGMYAIALYNKREKQLRLYRDPSGQKCIYYTHGGEAFAFSSEIKGLLSLVKVDRALDVGALNMALAVGYIPGRHTLLKHVRKVQPGEMVTISTDGRHVRCEGFSNKGQAYFAGQTPEAVIRQTVTEHLMSRHRAAINLSGGLDSSMLFHEARGLGYDIVSYTTRFDIPDNQYNEDADLAARLAQDFKSEHYEINIDKASYIRNFEEAYALVEEPNYNVSLPIYLATAKAEGLHGDGQRVVLSGDGGDEVFGGYAHYHANKRYDLASSWPFHALFRAAKNARRPLNFDYRSIPQRWLSFKSILDPSLLSQLPSGEALLSELDAVFDQYASNYRVHNKGSIYDMMIVDRCVWLSSENFARSDKLFMSQSIEMRNPLAYQPMRAYFDDTIPADEYISAASNKRFLRALYAGRLPSYILDKPKSGWRAPVKEWYGAELKALFLHIFEDARKSDTIINWRRLTDAVHASESYPGKHIHLFLSLAVLSKKLDLTI